LEHEKSHLLIIEEQIKGVNNELEERQEKVKAFYTEKKQLEKRQQQIATSSSKL